MKQPPLTRTLEALGTLLLTIECAGNRPVESATGLLLELGVPPGPIRTERHGGEA